ncbi:isoprenylcysteine carboxylmethyltransferase family protein [Chitinophaga sp. Cy-1792]|uniref:methyltransferase family protein n=1 Tax=Chitinophaga sp. Cy-1792 TaxID=2608339 RepID=UPI001422E36E|nr:isoprenylcysteine carboxylmethyltransferase family protein [Chitinophaga sp. Cy-1792]NIG56352.1 isoprenylcysteine carboxylmethyltransferase family protein [Chitinophaga sp. Cy-1792]
MHPLTIVIYCLWLASEIWLNRALRGSNTDKQNQDRGSLTAIWVVIAAGISAAVWLSGKPGARIAPDGVTVHYGGLIIILIGVVIRFAAVAQLGKYFTVMVTIREGHQVKKDGMYRLVRHPSYSASLLSFIGFGISTNSWYSFFAVVIPVFFVFIYRIRIEERALLKQFGQEYADYMQHTKRFIPYIF